MNPSYYQSFLPELILLELDKMGKRKLNLIDLDQEDAKDVGESSADGKEGSADDEQAAEIKPIGDAIKKAGRGKSEKRFYSAFEYDGNRYSLEDSVLVTPEEKTQKPYVAIIKEIKQAKDGSIAVTGQWFYRPEEAEKKEGGSWSASDARELFYSFHRDEVPAEAVMHKCVVHFIPPHKQSPPRSKHPGFIVRKVYDPVEKKLWNLTDKDYEDTKQKEIDLLVQKTQKALGDLETVEPEVVNPEPEKAEKIEKMEKPKRLLRKKNIPPLNVTRDEVPADEMTGSGETSVKPDQTPVSVGPNVQGGNMSDVYNLLKTQNLLTGNKARDKWLEKLVLDMKLGHDTSRGLKAHDVSTGNKARDKWREIILDIKQGHGSLEKNAKKQEESEDDKIDDAAWPEAAIQAASAVEKAAYDMIGVNELHKYNIKMRSLDFNLRQSHVLRRRLLRKELEPSAVVNMNPAELKDGFTTAEKAAREPQEPLTVQMADVKCATCGQRQVGVKDIIHAPHGDRYQLECLKCGNSWYSSRDAISSLTIEAVSPTPAVNTAPWVTSKFEEAEKERVAVKENEKSDSQIVNEAASEPPEASVPVQEPQKSSDNQLRLEVGGDFSKADEQARKEEEMVPEKSQDAFVGTEQPMDTS